MSRISETETVIKRIIPYLERRGYDIDKDLHFEEPVGLTPVRQGFIDILVNLGKKTPVFLIEAKRDGTKITAKHRKQALEYGESLKCLFVAITNGQYFELLNTETGNPIKINNSSFNRIPTKSDLVNVVVPQLKKNTKSENVIISDDRGLPFRPGLPLSKLNHLIKQCHNSIRKIEKNEEHAFSDFSKILFLKLLEEKWDLEGEEPPYSYLFHELANVQKERADQVQTAINSMIDTIKKRAKYSEVLSDPIKLKKDQAYLAIVKQISSISWNDCNLDSKGTAFEYFVRATLKGKKLGQYFTPRPLVQLMVHLGRYKQIIKNLGADIPFKVLDPSCGTGGFLVFCMNYCLREVEEGLKKKEIHKSLAEKLIKDLKEETFYGIDAHDGVASSAKMNMIIAGDGHNNIRCKDTLKEKSLLPSFTYKGEKRNKANLILTNPPFGTSEGESLSSDELSSYKIRSTKGQSLFIQKMIESIDSGSRIVTVIDEGVLNTASYANERKLILEQCRVEYIISLPDETFKPNKINVKSSVLVLSKREEPDVDFVDNYPLLFVKINSLGYDGAGVDLRGFDLNKLIAEVESLDANTIKGNKVISGYGWEAYTIESKAIYGNKNYRFDYKFWNADTIKKINSIQKKTGGKTIKELNLITTSRGSSPSASEYVSQTEGFALVVKAGSSISKSGLLITNGDYIEEPIYQTYLDSDDVLRDGDVILASTGEGTLGKCCVYRNHDGSGISKPAIGDGHVTIIRVNQKEVYPEYLCDYLRKGFGAIQINRLFTGATGLIEITPDDVDSICVPPLPKLAIQKSISKSLRQSEVETKSKIKDLLGKLEIAEKTFFDKSF